MGFEMPQPIQPLPRGSNSHLGQICCEKDRRRGHRAWELPREAPGQVKELSAGFVASCATKSVQIANAPTAQRCCLPTMKTEQYTRHLHPRPSPWQSTTSGLPRSSPPQSISSCMPGRTRPGFPREPSSPTSWGERLSLATHSKQPLALAVRLCPKH